MPAGRNQARLHILGQLDQKGDARRTARPGDQGLKLTGPARETRPAASHRGGSFVPLGLRGSVWAYQESLAPYG